MKKIIPKNVNAKLVWSNWQRPEDIKADEVPKLAGVYLLRAVDSNSREPYRRNKFYRNVVNAEVIEKLRINPANSNIQDREYASKRASELDGVIYIGLSRSRHTLNKRFVLLAESWSPQSFSGRSSGALHTSRKNFDRGIKNSKQILKQCTFEVAYMALPSTNQELNILEERAFKCQSEVMSIDNWLKKFDKLRGPNRRAEAMEAVFMNTFVRLFDELPILNIKDEGKSDRISTVDPSFESFIADHLSDLGHRSEVVEQSLVITEVSATMDGKERVFEAEVIDLGDEEPYPKCGSESLRPLGIEDAE